MDHVGVCKQLVTYVLLTMTFKIDMESTEGWFQLAPSLSYIEFPSDTRVLSS